MPSSLSIFSTFAWTLFADFSILSYIASCFVWFRSVDFEVVLWVELEYELPFDLDVLLLITFPARLLLALRRFLALNNEFLELLIFILYSYPFLLTFSCLFVRNCSEITCDKDAVWMCSCKEENSGLCREFLMPQTAFRQVIVISDLLTVSKVRFHPCLRNIYRLSYAKY